MGLADPTNVVRPAAWTMAAANVKRINTLDYRIAEAEARSNALTVVIKALVAADIDSRDHERRLWDILDVLQRLRFDYWLLSQARA